MRGPIKLLRAERRCNSRAALPEVQLPEPGRAEQVPFRTSGITPMRYIHTRRRRKPKATLTLTSADPPGPCGPGSSSVTITFTSQTAAPTVQSISNCAGSSATLSATAPGGEPTNGTMQPTGRQPLLSTGPEIFTTPVLSATTTYYVQTTNVNGVTSACAPPLP